MQPHQDWTAAGVFGMNTPQLPSSGVAAPTQDLAIDPIPGGWRRLVDPRNPLLWLGAVLAVTLGAAGVAGSVRLGRAKLAATVDRS